MAADRLVRDCFGCLLRRAVLQDRRQLRRAAALQSPGTPRHGGSGRRRRRRSLRVVLRRRAAALPVRVHGRRQHGRPGLLNNGRHAECAEAGGRP